MVSNKEFLAKETQAVETTETVVYQYEKKFVYVNLSNKHANMLFDTTLHKSHTIMHDTTSTEVHCTTDGAFELYLAKRKRMPKLCVIFNTQKELNNLLADNFGLIL